MLPPVIEEKEVFPFKFWFNNNIHDGMYYRNELFYRLHKVDVQQRARLYHYACKLSLREMIVVTATDSNCSIWVSLRSPNGVAPSLSHQGLPSFLEMPDE